VLQVSALADVFKGFGLNSKAMKTAAGQNGPTVRHRKSVTPVAPGPTSPSIHSVVGLFAGIGGLELGLQRAGHRTSLLCENDSDAQAVLKARFPHAPLHGDICTLKSLPEETSLVVAGFPCQDLSQAGRASGISGGRSGLVGEVFRLLSTHKVPWVLLENVPFMLQLGRGAAMNFIVSSLESLGYKWAYRVVDTRCFGLPQRRRRVYLVAALHGDPRSILFADDAREFRTAVSSGRIAKGFYWTEGTRGLGWALDAVPTLKGGSSLGIPSAPAILLPDGHIGTPDIRDAERLQGFPANWTKPAALASRASSRWKLVGNAVSVPAANWIGRRLFHPSTPIDFPSSALHDSAKWPCAAWNVGEGRRHILASEWPVCRTYKSLESFLRFPVASLSEKAATGFLGRARDAKLRFEPGFLDAVARHIELMQFDAPSPASRPRKVLPRSGRSRVSVRGSSRQAKRGTK
jgi:DNA (cytosine-5)-methyltransferase 1